MYLQYPSSISTGALVAKHGNVTLGANRSDIVDIKGLMYGDKIIVRNELDITSATLTVSQVDAANQLDNIVIGRLNITTLKFQYLQLNDM